MSQNRSILALSIAATAVLVSQTFVTAAGANAAAAASALGVTRSDAKIGDLVPVDVLGTAIVTAAGAIAQFAEVEVGANGQAVTHAAGKVVGIALEAAAALGDSIEVYLIQSS